MVRQNNLYNLRNFINISSCQLWNSYFTVKRAHFFSRSLTSTEWCLASVHRRRKVGVRFWFTNATSLSARSFQRGTRCSNGHTNWVSFRWLGIHLTWRELAGRSSICWTMRFRGSSDDQSPATPCRGICSKPVHSIWASTHSVIVVWYRFCHRRAPRAAWSSARALHWLSPGTERAEITWPEVAFKTPHAAMSYGVLVLVAVPSVKTWWCSPRATERKKSPESSMSNSVRFHAAAKGEREGSKWAHRAWVSYGVSSFQPSMECRSSAKRGHFNQWLGSSATSHCAQVATLVRSNLAWWAAPIKQPDCKELTKEDSKAVAVREGTRTKWGSRPQRSLMVFRCWTCLETYWFQASVIRVSQILLSVKTIWWETSSWSTTKGINMPTKLSSNNQNLGKRPTHQVTLEMVHKETPGSQ